MPRRANDHRRPPRIHIYPTYQFAGKDPAIRKVLALQEEEGLKQSIAAQIAGISKQTPARWRAPDGVRRPQFASIAAFAAACGYDIVFKRRRVQTDVETGLANAAKQREREEQPGYRPNIKDYEFA